MTNQTSELYSQASLSVKGACHRVCKSVTTEQKAVGLYHVKVCIFVVIGVWGLATE